MTVKIDFGSGFIDVSDYVKYDTLSINRQGYNSNYKASQSVCRFSLIYDASIYAMWFSSGELAVELYDGATLSFRGIVDKTRSREYDGVIGSVFIDIEANDYLTVLDVPVGDIVYADCKVLDPTDPTNSIVHKLVAITGNTINVSSTVTIDTVIQRFSPGNDTQTVRNVLDTLLYEYGYSLHLDKGYILLPIKWAVDSATTAHTFNNSNCIGKVSTKNTLDKYDTVTVTYNILAQANDVRLYTDNNCTFDSNGEFAGYSVPNGFDYPPEANVIDDTTGEKQLVYQDYTDVGIKYRTNKAIVNNLDYNYKNFESDFTAIITTENHFVDRGMDADITVVTEEFGAKRCRLLYRNSSGSAKNIYYNNVYGTVWYRSADCTTTVGDKDSDKLDNYKTQYVYNKAVAENLAKALHAQYTAGNTIYSLTYDGYIPEGTLVTVFLGDGTNIMCQIMSSVYNGKTELYDYKCISCSANRPLLSSQTYSYSGAVTQAPPFTIQATNKTINVPYVDGAPVYTNAYTTITVSQEGINVTSGWTLTATPMGVTGHFEGNSYFIDTAPAVGGSVVITASKTGFNSIATIIQVQGSDGGSTWQPLAPLVDVVAIKDGLEVTLTDKYLSGIQGINSYTATWYYNDVEQATMAFGDLNTVLLPFASNAFYEVDDINLMSVKVRVVNTSGLGATTWVLEGAIDTDNYGTWNVLPPDAIYAQSANRAANVTWQKKDISLSGKPIYGITFYDIQISKDGTNWFKPAQGKTGKVSEDDWKDGTGYLRLSGGGWSQSLPLTGQTNNLPENTTYYYRVRTRGITDTYVSAWSDPVTAIALATGIGDIIEKSVKEAQLGDSSVSNIKIQDNTIVASDKVVSNTITTELLNVLAKNKINNFSITGTLEGWTTAGTLEDDASGFKKLRFTNSGFLSNVFTVQPNEICSFEFGISCPNYTSLSGAYIGLTQGQIFRHYAWSFTLNKWIAGDVNAYVYFIHNYKATTVKYFKTYILGSNVSINDIPAPSTTDATYPLYAFQLQGTDTTARLRTGFNPITAGTYWELYLPQVYSGQGGKIVAQQIITPSLSAINVNAGVITSGILRAIIKAGESKPNVFLNLDTEEFRVGNNPSLEDSNHEDAEYLHWIPNQGLFLKLKNLIVDALASTIRGRFRVRGTTATMAQSVLIVNPESTVDPDTNTPANTTDIKTALRCPAGITGNLTGNSATATLAGRAKDSYPIPTDAVLQYSFDEIKQLPDNPAGTVYKRDNDWTTVDVWATGSATASIVENKLSILSSSSNTAYILRGMTVTNKRIRAYLKRSNAGEVHLYGTIGGVFTLLGKRTIEANMYYTIDGYINGTTNNVQIYFIGLTSGNTAIVQAVYVGDGSYLEPVIDNSYSESHAENHGVIPVDGVCGKAGYFNNSYMIAPRPALGDDITIYFWAKFDALGIQTIVQSRTVVGEGLSVFMLASNYYLLHWRGNQATFTGYTPPVNTWHHVCMKMNATSAVLKINGETKVTLTGTYGTTQNLASTIWSGMSGTGGTPNAYPLTGALDGLKIVPRFTTDDEDTGEYKARANHPKFYATADKWKTARNITISDADGTNTGTAVSVDGSENETLKLPATIKANLTGKANVRVSLRHGNMWYSKTWTGLTGLSVLDGTDIWTDRENIYLSTETKHFILNKATSTWVAKTWTGLSDFYGKYIWTDGDNIYNNSTTRQFVLNKDTLEWSAKTWNGLIYFDARYIWKDGENIYYSSGTAQYVLNKSTSTWVAKTWTGLPSFYGGSVWTDGENIYYSSDTTQYVLNKSTSTWSSKTWNGLTVFSGGNVWTDGDNIYSSDSNGAEQYVLNKSTSTWIPKIWNNTSLIGAYIWTDGDVIYHDNATSHVFLSATRHNYVDDSKYNPLLGKTIRCNCSTLSDWFVFRNE